MDLGGQGNQRGYAMAALLVSIGVMTLMMSVLMPVWRHQAQREKEAELVFRGEQYARAINLYTRKMGGANYPPTLDILVQQRFLRKKYKDPMTKDGEFEVITAAGSQQGRAGQQPGGRRGNAPSTGLSQPPQTPSAISTPNRPGAPSAQGPGGILGVRSKSTEASIRIYRGGTHYNEWQFLFANVSNRPGMPSGQGAPGGPGGVDGRGRRGAPGVNPPGPPGGPGRGPGTFGPAGAGRPGGRSNPQGPVIGPGIIRRGGGA
jgi:type II secretory pathway pseudopilin PulG